MKRQLQVGVVILNWKRPEDTLLCLETLTRRADIQLDIVVVDNSGEARWAREFRERYPSVEVIENERNLGFAGGCNVGIRRLMARGVDYVLLHNDDAVLASDTLRLLIAEAERDPNIGIVGPTICYADHEGRPDVIWSAGGSVDWIGRPSHPNEGAHHTSSAVTPRDVDYVSGCMLLAKRSFIQRAGFLDERFFAYFEETEWCARARSLGFRVSLVPDARAWHRITPHERGESPTYMYLMARNRLLYLRCTAAPVHVVACAITDTLRTATSWSLRKKHESRRRFAPVLRRAVQDAALGRFGAPPSDL
jgi:GT2 family glycosyltransferase